MAVDADSPDGELNESTTAGSRSEPSSADSSPESPEAAAGAEADVAATENAEDVDSDVAEYPVDADEEADDVEADGVEPTKKPSRFALSHTRLAVAVGLVVVLGLGGLAGWLGFRAYESQQADEQRQLLLQAARQGAINLTTLNWQNADADVQRILDSATGTFYDDFSQRSEPFVEVLTKTQSKTEGTITDAGLESVSGDEAQVLVAVQVKTSNMAEPEQEPRFWRMRLSVQKVSDDEAKVSTVAFIP